MPEAGTDGDLLEKVGTDDYVTAWSAVLKLQALAQETLVEDTQVNLDFSNKKPIKILDVAGTAVELITNNRAAGRTMRVYIRAGASDVTIITESGIHWVGLTPVNVPAGKIMVLVLHCVFGSALSDVVGEAGYEL